MSRIHQALCRAEKDGRSSLPTPMTQEVTATPYKTSSSEVFGPAKLENDRAPSVEVSIELVEEKTTLDSKIIAGTSDTYDQLGQSLKNLRTKAEAAGSKLKSVMITSADSGEGKSLAATNLSIAVTRMYGQRVLLIDGNLRHPSVHELLGMTRGRGLCDLLHGDCSASQIIAKTNLPSFFVVIGGNTSKNPTELLNTRRMSDFLSLMRRQFDWVFLDAPAILPHPDAELLSSFVDGVIVLSGSLTQPGSILEVLQTLRGKNVLGLVMNGEIGPAHSEASRAVRTVAV